MNGLVRRVVVFPLASLIIASGCGGADSKLDRKRPPTYRVNGKVLLNGQPVADAGVVFRSSGSAETLAAYGRTDSGGEFTLTTFESGDGAIAGQHMMTVTKSVVEGEDRSYFDEKSPNYGKTPPPTKTKFLVPEKYSKFETSGLSTTVKDSGSTGVLIELTDK